MEHKSKIQNQPASKVEELLDIEEADIEDFAIWQSNNDMRGEGLGISSQIREIPGCGVLSDLFDKFVKDLLKINREVFICFSWKFGDYLSFHAKNATPDNYKQLCDESFLYGHAKAVKLAHKKLIALTVTYIKKLLGVLCVNKIESFILEQSSNALDPLNSQIPEPINEVLDLPGQVSDVIKETIEHCVDEIVASINPAFQESIFGKSEK